MFKLCEIEFELVNYGHQTCSRGEDEEFNDLCLLEEMALQIEYRKFKRP